MSPAGRLPRLIGETAVPGDKSVTHRALLLGAVAAGETVVQGALASRDTLSTARIVQRLGARVRWDALVACGSRDPLVVEGLDELKSPRAPLDCGNAATSARLLAGLLAGRTGRWVLDGDESLRGRPMDRVTGPLAGLGARLAGDHLPLTVEGAALRGGEVRVDLPSAQVKSALLLAGLVTDGPLTVVQHQPTRDHTERMLPRFGVSCETVPGSATVTPGRPHGARVDVPGDPSSAAFLTVAALLLPGSELWLRDIGLWPRRTGFLRALLRAGADISVVRRTGLSDPTDDPRGDLRVAASELTAFEIAPEDVPDLVDEIPILALAAARAEGTSHFAGLSELRVKESDRLQAIADLLAALGVPVEPGPDSLTITGVKRLAAPECCDHPDHRLTLTAAVACLLSGKPLPETLPTAIISFPGFPKVLGSLLVR